MNIVLDIEAIGRTHISVFAIAFCIKYNGETSTRVFYLTPLDSSPDTLKWWNSDKKRAAFMEASLLEAKKYERVQVIKEVRMFLDDLYSKGEDVTIYSDFPTFDVGMVSALLADEGLLPVYLKDDSSPPFDVVNYNTFLRGIARVSPNESSKVAYKKMKLTRPTRADNHDPEEDVLAIMEEVDMVLQLIE